MMFVLLCLQFIAQKVQIEIPPDMLEEEENDMVRLSWIRLFLNIIETDYSNSFLVN